MSAQPATKDAHVTSGEPEIRLVPMLTISRAIDLFLGDCARRGYSTRTQDTYGRLLDKFEASLPQDTDVTELAVDHVRKYLDGWKRHAPGTRAHAFSVMSSFCKWLYKNEKIKRNPIDKLDRPKRTPPENLNTKKVSADDVRALLDHAEGWTEKLAVAIPAYLGVRRRAAALLRLRDYNRKREQMRFQEKGGKVIWKPVPFELAALLEDAIKAGAIQGANAYLIPSEGPLWDGHTDRDDRVVWRAVKSAADRAAKAGHPVDGHVHALRAAFAVFYLERNPNDIEGLRVLMGHRSIATTQVYLRYLDHSVAMERVKTLSWHSAEKTIPSPMEREAIRKRAAIETEKPGSFPGAIEEAIRAGETWTKADV